MSTDPNYERGWLPLWGVEVFRGLLLTIFKILAPIEVQGLENLPATGGFIVAANHVSYWDAPLIFVNMRRGTQMTVFGADKYRRHPLLGLVLRLVGVIWVNREAPTPATIKMAVQLLRNGSMLGVAPEGTRSQATHALQPAKTGAAYLAMMAGVPVVPAALIHTGEVAGDLMHLRRSHVTIKFGRPLTFALAGRHERDAKLEEYTDEVMCQIAAMLPPEYHGIYAGHPRLKELLIG